MTQNQTQNSNRIFGEAFHAPSYSLKAASWVPATVGVYEDVSIHRIFFPIAGYTQSITYYPSEMQLLDTLLRGCQGTNRQNVIHDMHKHAPIGALIHGQAEMVREPNNKYDPNAIQVIGYQTFSTELKARAAYPIGYVPARCGTNKRILAKWDKIIMPTGQVTILKDSKGHLIPMVSFEYSVETLAKDNRFARLQYE